MQEITHFIMVINGCCKFKRRSSYDLDVRYVTIIKGCLMFLHSLLYRESITHTEPETIVSYRDTIRVGHLRTSAIIPHTKVYYIALLWCINREVSGLLRCTSILIKGVIKRFLLLIRCINRNGEKRSFWYNIRVLHAFAIDVWSCISRIWESFHQSVISLRSLMKDLLEALQ